MIEVLASALLNALLLWLASALACAGLYSRLRPRLLALEPVQAGNYLLALLSLPALCALTTTLLLYYPDASRQLVNLHCHAGNCSEHGPILKHAALPAAVLLLWYGGRVATTVRHHWWGALHLARQLRATGARRRGIV